MALSFNDDEWDLLKSTFKKEHLPFKIEGNFPPIQFSSDELKRLEDADERNYVLTIKNDIVKDRPDLADDPNLLERLNAAYDEAKRFGLTDDHRIVQFLYLDSVDPSFYTRPAVARWLNQQGLPPEQRFDMMLDVARAKLRDKQQEKK